jgi:hypothetical protein
MCVYIIVVDPWKTSCQMFTIALYYMYVCANKRNVARMHVE